MACPACIKEAGERTACSRKVASLATTQRATDGDAGGCVGTRRGRVWLIDFNQSPKRIRTTLARIAGFVSCGGAVTSIGDGANAAILLGDLGDAVQGVVLHLRDPIGWVAGREI